MEDNTQYMDLYSDVGVLALIAEFDHFAHNNELINLDENDETELFNFETYDPTETVLGSFVHEVIKNIVHEQEQTNTINHEIESSDESTCTTPIDTISTVSSSLCSYLISKEEHAQKKFALFREDIIDYFSCILSELKKNNIKSKNNYEKRFQKIVKEFRLRTILKTINYLIHDKAILKIPQLYITVFTICNDIISNDIMQCTLKSQPKYQKYIF
jgi:hypothetical protein